MSLCGLHLTARELACLRPLAESALSLTATIQERTLADNGQGGQTATYATDSVVPCNLIRKSMPGELAIAGAVQAPSIYTLLLPAGTVLLHGWRVLIGTDATQYEVRSVDLATPAAVLITAEVMRLD